jgi:hypothetical protein
MTIAVSKYLKLFGLFNPESIFSEGELTYINDCLSHSHERKNNERDIWGNWDASFVSENFRVPYLDLFIRERLAKNNIPFKSIWGDNNLFSVCLTHDVDRVESYSPTSFLRDLKKQKLFENNLFNRLKIQFNILKTSIKKRMQNKVFDELWCYERWVDLENKYGVKSTYFFFVRPDEEDISIYDCDYELIDEIVYDSKKVSVAQYIKRLKNDGFEIGLHGSFYSFNNRELFGKQKEVLEALLETKIYSTRQHYLHYEINKTPNVHAENGVFIDSTLGFNTDVGYRAGTSFPYYIETSRGAVLEIPLIIMDSALFSKNGLDYSMEDAKKTIIDIFDVTEEVGGCVTINFHPDYLNISKYFDTYKFILDEITRRKAKVLSMREIQTIIERVCAE